MQVNLKQVRVVCLRPCKSHKFVKMPDVLQVMVKKLTSAKKTSKLTVTDNTNIICILNTICEIKWYMRQKQT